MGDVDGDDDGDGDDDEITQENPTQPMASESMSARIDGYELPAGKYAWNLVMMPFLLVMMMMLILMVMMISMMMVVVLMLALDNKPPCIFQHLDNREI